MLTINLGFVQYRDFGNAHICLAPLANFTNITAFVHNGYATSLDVSHLQNAANLIFIEISRCTYSIYNLEHLAALPDLLMLGLPWHLMIDVAESGIFGDNVLVTGGG